MNSMALLALLVWIGVPILAGWMFVVLPKRAKTTTQRTLFMVAGIGVLIAPWLISNTVKWYYDQQVRELCEKDGGVKVYETITLSVDKFNQWGQPNFYQPNQGQNALGSDYTFNVDMPDFRNGNSPKVFRTHYTVIRHSDNKLLGEAVIYGRSGGDLPGPWYGSSFNCPNFPEGEISLFRAIFLNSNKD